MVLKGTKPKERPSPRRSLSPAFTKSRNSIKNAVKGYREINIRGLKLVKDGGYLATCSCSHFMSDENFKKMFRVLFPSFIRPADRLIPTSRIKLSESMDA
mgnify:CR=1 FL=1